MDEQDKLDDENGEFQEEEDEEAREKRIKEEYNPGLLKAAEKGDIEEMKRLLDKGAQLLTEDKKKWNALIWASCRGHVDMVRFLLNRGAGSVYKKGYVPLKSPNESPNKDNNIMANKSMGLNFDDPNTKEKVEKTNGPGVINEKARNTPLQWASFKGHSQIICLLLKDGQDILECDPFGNNSIHQAVAGGFVDPFKILLEWGVKLHYVNNRGHSVADLCTNPETMRYIKKFKETEKALGIDPKDEKVTIYLCAISDQFKSKNEVEHYWLFESKDSVDEEKFETRSHQEHTKVLQHQDDLMRLINSYDYGALTTKIRFCEDNKIHIEAKLLDKAYIHQEKLRTQIEIMDFIHSVSEVENYKTIKKSINTLEEKVRDAGARGVILDQSIFDAVKACIDRLNAERNLRFELDNLQVNGVKHEEVKTLEERKVEAKDRSVAEKYLDDAEELKSKMEKHLHAREIFKNFSEYPEREAYPLFKYFFDLKTGKKMDKATKKPIDPAKLYPPKPKKKGKKAPKWVIPDWALDTSQLKVCMQTLDGYIQNKEDLALDDEFIEECQKKMENMKKEYELRVELDKEAKFEAEKKAKKKKA